VASAWVKNKVRKDISTELLSDLFLTKRPSWAVVSLSSPAAPMLNVER